MDYPAKYCLVMGDFNAHIRDKSALNCNVEDDLEHNLLIDFPMVMNDLKTYLEYCN